MTIRTAGRSVTPALLTAAALMLAQAAAVRAQSVTGTAFPRAVIGPNEIDFGITNIGERKGRVFTIKNRGDAPLAVRIDAPADPFHFAEPGIYVVEPGEILPLPIEYVSTDIGRHKSEIRFTTNDPLNENDFIRLKGRGAPERELGVKISPTVIEVASTVGQGTPSFITLENQSKLPRRVKLNVAVGFPEFHFPGDKKVQIVGLNPKETKQIIVGFEPRGTGLAKGKVNAKMLDVRPKPRALNPVFLFGEGLPPKE